MILGKSLGFPESHFLMRLVLILIVVRLNKELRKDTSHSKKAVFIFSK